MTRPLALALLALAGSFAGCGPDTRGPAPDPKLEAWLDDIARRAAEARDRPVLIGPNGWLFLPADLSALAARLPAGDEGPVAAIADLRDQLERAGVRLVVVPVPTKAAVHPDELPVPRAAGRLDVRAEAWRRALAGRGVEVLDLVPAWLEERGRGGPPLWCRSDSHWSPRGIAVAARAIAARIAREPWASDLAREELASETREIEIEGDLWRTLAEPRPPRERLTLTVVGRPGAGGIEPVSPARTSPVLLLGDSHLLVFHAGGDLHATGGGLPDLLSLELGAPVDVLGVRGSGATPARVSLARRAGGLAGKKIVFWVFSMRELDPASGTAWSPVSVVP